MEQSPGRHLEEMRGQQSYFLSLVGQELRTDTQWPVSTVLQKCWRFFSTALGDQKQAYASLAKKVKAELPVPREVKRTPPLRNSEDPQKIRRDLTSEIDVLL